MNNKTTTPESVYLATLLDEKDIQHIKSRLLVETTWVSHVNRNNYQGSWDVLSLRCLNRHKEAHPILQCFTHDDPVHNELSSSQNQGWVNLPLMEQYPAIHKVFSYLQCPIKSIRFMRLGPKDKILPHRDEGVSLQWGEARLHIPIISTPLVNFIVASHKVNMNPGELWYIDADKEHSVENNGSQERVHLVIDCLSNNWLKDKVSSAINKLCQ